MAESYIVRKGGGGGAQIEEQVRNFLIESGNTITPGIFVKFKNKIAPSSVVNSLVLEANIAIAGINSTTAIIFYHEPNASGRASAVVVTVNSSNQISFGTPVIFENSGVNPTSWGAKLIPGTNNVLFRYDMSNTSPYRSQVRVASVSGTTITFGNAQTYINNQHSWHQVAVTSSTQAVIMYRDTVDGRGRLQAISISGTSVSFGGQVLFNDNTTTQWLNIAPVSSTTALFSYQNSVGTFLRVVSLSGTSASLGTALQFNTQSESFNRIILTNLTSTTVLATNGLYLASIPTVSRVITISGTTITSTGTANNNAFSLGFQSDTVEIKLSSNQVMYFFNTSSSLTGIPTTAAAAIGSISGNTVTWGVIWVFPTFGQSGQFNSINQDRAGFLSSEKVILLRKNNLDSNNLTVHIVPTWSNLNEIYNVENSTSADINGLAKTGGTAGQTIEVYVNQ
jgi:hypothetical protein